MATKTIIYNFPSSVNLAYSVTTEVLEQQSRVLLFSADFQTTVIGFSTRESLLTFMMDLQDVLSDWPVEE